MHVFVVNPAPPPHLPIHTHPKFILGAVCKETLKGKWQYKSRNPRTYHPKWKLPVFEKKQRKENGMRKEGIHDLTIQSSVLQAFEKKETVEGKETRKVGIQDRASKVHFC